MILKKYFGLPFFVLMGIIYAHFLSTAHAVFLVSIDQPIDDRWLEDIYHHIRRCSFPPMGPFESTWEAEEKITKALSLPGEKIAQTILEDKLFFHSIGFETLKIKEVPNLIWNLHVITECLTHAPDDKEFFSLLSQYKNNGPKSFQAYFTLSNRLAKKLEPFGEEPSLEDYQQKILPAFLEQLKNKSFTGARETLSSILLKDYELIIQGAPTILSAALKCELDGMKKNQVVLFRATNGFSSPYQDIDEFTLQTAYQVFENNLPSFRHKGKEETSGSYENFKQFIKNFNLLTFKEVMNNSLMNERGKELIETKLKVQVEKENYINEDGTLKQKSIPYKTAVDLYISHIRVICADFLCIIPFDEEMAHFQNIHQELSARQLLDFCGESEGLKLEVSQPEQILPQGTSVARNLSYSLNILDGYLFDGPTSPQPGMSACTYQYYHNCNSKYVYTLSFNKEEYYKHYHQFFHLGEGSDDQKVLGAGERFHPRLRSLQNIESKQRDYFGSPLSQFSPREDVASFKAKNLTRDQRKTAGWILEINDLMAARSTILSIQGRILSSSDDPQAQKILINHKEASERFRQNIEKNFQ